MRLRHEPLLLCQDMQVRAAPAAGPLQQPPGVRGSREQQRGNCALPRWEPTQQQNCLPRDTERTMVTQRSNRL